MSEKTFEREVLDALIEIRTFLGSVRETIADHREVLYGNGKEGLKLSVDRLRETPDKIKSIDQRVSDLEALKWKLIGGFAVVQVIVAVAVNYIIKYIVK